MTKRRSFIDRVPLAPVFAVMFGAVAAILVGAMPQWMFEANVAATGVGNVLAVAQPPLGTTARVLAMIVAFALVGALVWLAAAAAVTVIGGPMSRERDADDVLDLGDYAAPPLAQRGPISAVELGAPLMSDEALATVAARAADAEPGAAVEADPVLGAPLAVEEFDLPAAPDEADFMPGESSIDALIRRLEAGLAKRPRPEPPTPGGSVPPSAGLRDWMVRDHIADNDRDDGRTRALDALRRMTA